MMVAVSFGLIFVLFFNSKEILANEEIEKGNDDHQNQFKQLTMASESIRKSNFRIYAMNVSPYSSIQSNYRIIINGLTCKKYPPGMSIEMKDADSGLVKYKGIAVEFCNYNAQHYDLT